MRRRDGVATRWSRIQMGGYAVEVERQTQATMRLRWSRLGRRVAAGARLEGESRGVGERARVGCPRQLLMQPWG